MASGFPASATCIRRPVESVTKAWGSPPEAPASRSARQEYRSRHPSPTFAAANSPPATGGASPGFVMNPPYDAAMASRSGETDNCR